MSLPVNENPTEAVELPNGGTVTVRGLTRGEALAVAKFASDAGALEVRLLELGAGVTRAEAEEFYSAAPSADVDAITTTVARLSGLDPDQGK